MQLTTERLLLREVRQTDWPAVHEFACDVEVTRFTSFGPNTEEQTKSFVEHGLADARAQPRTFFALAITLLGEDRVIGGCSLRLRDDANREGELAYLLHRDYWGRGYIPEAARAFLAFGFEELGLHRIIARCNPLNTASERVMQKLGMQREGLLRESAFMKGCWIDLLLYSILEWEWKERREGA